MRNRFVDLRLAGAILAVVAVLAVLTVVLAQTKAAQAQTAVSTPDLSGVWMVDRAEGYGSSAFNKEEEPPMQAGLTPKRLLFCDIVTSVSTFLRLEKVNCIFIRQVISTGQEDFVISMAA